MFKHIKFDIVAFCKDWNAGMTVAELAAKYKISKASVRGRVNAWRKKGVELGSRRGPGYGNLTETEVESINLRIK